MKKIAIILAIIICIASLGMVVHAEEPAEDNEQFIRGWLDTITSSSLWVSVSAYLVAAVGIIATFAKRTRGIAELVKNKATREEIVTAVKDAKGEFVDEIAKLKTELEADKEEKEKMRAIMCIFFANAKINPHAREEISKILQGLKDGVSTAAEMIEKAQTAISEATEAEEHIETPALDALIEPAMILE